MTFTWLEHTTYFNLTTNKYQKKNIYIFNVNLYISNDIVIELEFRISRWKTILLHLLHYAGGCRCTPEVTPPDQGYPITVRNLCFSTWRYTYCSGDGEKISIKKDPTINRFVIATPRYV